MPSVALAVLLLACTVDEGGAEPDDWPDTFANKDDNGVVIIEISALIRFSLLIRV